MRRYPFQETHPNARRPGVATPAVWRGPLFIGAILGVCLFLLAACDAGNATPTSAALVAAAQSKFDATQSFHFIMQVENAGAASTTGLDIRSAEGDGQRPDKISAKAKVATVFATVDVQLVVIGQQGWYTNPLTGTFVTSDQLGSFLLLFDKQQGIGAMVGGLGAVSAPADGSANGVPCWKITGTVPSERIAAIVGGAASASAPLSTTVCLAKSDGSVASIAFKGIVLAGDSAQTTRTFYFSNYNKPVTIQPPV